MYPIICKQAAELREIRKVAQWYHFEGKLIFFQVKRKLVFCI